MSDDTYFTRDELIRDREKYFLENLEMRAEIERLRTENEQLCDDIKTHNRALRMESADKAELLAALRPFAKLYARPGHDLDAIIQKARAAIAKMEGK